MHRCYVKASPANLEDRNLLKYPLARNQYINNSPGILSCTRAGANTGAACIRTKWIPLRIWHNTREISPQKYFPVFARVRMQAPHVFAQKLIPQEFFPACIGFVPGGKEARLLKFHFSEAIIVFGDNELNAPNAMIARHLIAFRTSKCCNR